MKKSKLSLGLIACLLSVGTLAGCDKIKSSSDGVLLSYTVDGVKGTITADQILGDYYNDSTKYQAIYDTIYSVIARNYFSKDRGEKEYQPGVKVQLGEPQMANIKREAAEKVSDDKDTAQSNADANNTKYKKEFEAILESKGVDSEEELLEKYIEELQKETFENNFYTYFVEEIKNGNNGEGIAVKSLSSTDTLFTWNGYLHDQLPYHMSHILVKLSDSSDTNYYNGTISEDNALRLYDVITALGAGEKSFSKIAMTYNEDPGSKDKKGDLGIMDYDTSFINEFKLGIYAYEQFYNGTNVEGSEIEVDDDIKDGYLDAAKEAFGLTNKTDLPTVELSVFEELKNVAKEDKDINGKAVIENSTLVYPRNIIYNKYLNRHAVFFIEGPAGGNYVANWNDSGKNILCADGDKTKPIIAVRASSGGEQEIHLMVVNRSPFAVEDKDGNNLIPLNQYYTTFYPDQEYYPTKTVEIDGKEYKQKLDTYVNFLSNDTSETKSRAEEFASKLKSYNSDKLGKYIFLKYANEEKIQFTEETSALAEALMKWIKTSLTKSEEERDEAWTKTWNEYIDKLVRQNSERLKLVPQACRLAFKYANYNEEDGNENKKVNELPNYAEIKALLVEEGIAESKADTLVSNWFNKEGGLCNDGKKHA